MIVMGLLTWLRDSGTTLAARWYIEALRSVAFAIEHCQWARNFEADVEAIPILAWPNISTHINRALKAKIADMAAAGDKGLSSGASVAHAMSVWRKGAATRSKLVASMALSTANSLLQHYTQLT